MLDRQRKRRSRGSRQAPEDQEPEEEPVFLDAPPQRGLWLYLLVPVAGILLCGNKEAWALGVLALLIGLTALLAPPRNPLPRKVTIPILLGLLLCLATFLPASWFALPEWREILQRDFGFILPSTHSPQPWVSLESWMALAVGAVWLFCCIGRGFSSEERRRSIQFFAVFLALLAGAAIAISYWKIEVPLWRGADKAIMYFGPFPNRNNFSGLLAIGAVLALAAAHDGFRHGYRMRWLYLLAIVPMFVAILSNTSRMGVLLLFAGTGTWMFMASLRRQSVKRAAVIAAMLMIMAAIVLLYGRPILDRITGGEAGVVASLARDLRWKIFSDATDMIARSPIVGSGLGNFEPVFALGRESGELHSRTLHPENDWLWLGAEAGIPVLLLAIFAAIALALMFGMRRRHRSAGRQDRRLRSAAGIGALLLLVSGLVNTPMHAPGFIVFGCLLSGLALAPVRADTARSVSVPLRRGLGLIGLACGALWLLTAFGHSTLCGNSYYKLLARRAAAAEARGDVSGSLEAWNQAAAVKPLQWSIYFERAMLKLRLGRPHAEALRDFSCWRQLERNNANLCYREFDFWLPYNPVFGVAALREAMRRDPLQAVLNYGMRLWHMRAHPELRPHFLAMAQADPKLALAYLPEALPGEVMPLIDDLLTHHRDLGIFTPEEKTRFFQLWKDRGDSARLIQMLQENTVWQKDGWSVLAAHRVSQGDFRGAYQAAIDNIPKPVRIASRADSDVDALMRDFSANPTSFTLGFSLCEAQRRAGRLDDALATLDQLAQIPQSPASILYERATILAEKGDHASAWKTILDYSQRLGKQSPAT